MAASSAGRPSEHAAATGASSGDVAQLLRLGYRQELDRRLGFFGNFSLSFSLICIVAGCITSYQQAVAAVGGAGIGLGWPAGCLIALAIAWPMQRLARAFPVAGSLFHWSTMLGGRGWGWATAWLNLAGLFFVTAAIEVGTWQIVATDLLPQFGVTPTSFPPAAQLLAVALIVASQAVIASAGIALTGRIAALGTVLIVAVGAIITLGLLWYAPSIDLGRLVTFTNFSGDPGAGVWPASDNLARLFVLSLLLPTYTISGFDASAHFAEETVDASNRVPKAIFLSVLISAIAGWIMTAAFVLAPPSLAQSVAQGGDAAIQTIVRTLPRALTAAIVTALALSNYVCGFAALVSTTRALWAFARADGLSGAAFLRRVEPKRRVPLAAGWVTALLVVLAVSYTPAYAALAAASVILLYVSYVMPPAAGILAAARGRRAAGGFPLTAGFIAVSAVAILGVGLVFYAGIQPPSDGALWMTLGLIAALGLAWLVLGRGRYPGGPEVRLRAEIEAGLAASSGPIRRRAGSGI